MNTNTLTILHPATGGEASSISQEELQQLQQRLAGLGKFDEEAVNFQLR